VSSDSVTYHYCQYIVFIIYEMNMNTKELLAFFFSWKIYQ